MGRSRDHSTANNSMRSRTVSVGFRAWTEPRNDKTLVRCKCGVWGDLEHYRVRAAVKLRENG